MLKRCFDRRKQKHHAECKKQFEKSSDSVKVSVDNKPCPLSISHYKDTFKAKLDARPASMCQPLPDVHQFLPKGTMDFNTSNKSDFKAYEVRGRTKSMKKIDKYEKSDAKMSGNTSYGSEYFAKALKGCSFNAVKKNPNETT